MWLSRLLNTICLRDYPFPLCILGTVVEVTSWSLNPGLFALLQCLSFEGHWEGHLLQQSQVLAYSQNFLEQSLLEIFPDKIELIKKICMRILIATWWKIVKCRDKSWDFGCVLCGATIQCNNVYHSESSGKIMHWHRASVMAAVSVDVTGWGLGAGLWVVLVFSLQFSVFFKFFTVNTHYITFILFTF